MMPFRLLVAISLAFFAAMSTALVAAEKQAPREAFIHWLLIGGSDLDVSKLHPTTEDFFKQRTGKVKLASWPFPIGPVMHTDPFEYVIYYDEVRKEFWVNRFGGLGGRTWYGPDHLPSGAGKNATDSSPPVAH